MRELRIRDRSRCSGVSPRAATSGIMLTPVSNPDSPSTSSGNAMMAGQISPPKPPPPSISASVHRVSVSGVLITSAKPTPRTTPLTTKNSATTGIAMPTASLNPSRNTPPRMSSSTMVIHNSVPCRKDGTIGFSTRCTAASDADSVMVTIHDVSTNPSRASTNSFPRQNDSSRSSIATEPWPCGLSSATRRYIGSIPNRVSATISRVASGEIAPAASAAIPGRYASVEK